MSDGPIKRDREARRAPTVSTTEKDRVCMAVDGRAYCGRSLKSGKATGEWSSVVCADCQAARRADEAVAGAAVPS